MSKIKKAIKVLNKILLNYKPDGIGGSCNCDACNKIRPTYDAISFSIYVLGKVDKNRIRNIICKGLYPNYGLEKSIIELFDPVAVSIVNELTIKK